MSSPGEPEPPSDAGNVVRWLVVASLFLFLLSGPIYAVLSSDDEGAPPPGPGSFGGATMELDDLSVSLASMYRGVRSHGRHIQRIPCFCGCDRGLRHRHLLDCFVRADGSGWESHASGCGVCRGEARMALRMFEAGTPSEEIRDRIVDEFGMSEQMQDTMEEGRRT